MTIPDRFNVTAQDTYNYVASKFFADQQLCMVLKFDGKINEDALARAIRLTLDLEPVLGCRLVEDSGNLYWERRKDLNQIKTCMLVEAASLEQALLSFINETIHADADPLVTSRVFRDTKSDTVCIKVNHSVCDAGGLKEYVLLLSRVYNSLIT